MAAGILVAKETFVADTEDGPRVIHKGIERVREGHPIAKAYPEMFEPVTVHFDLDVEAPVEQATAAPGEARPTRRRKPVGGGDA